MTPEEVLKKLEEMGTEQNRKIYSRHGISDNMYGVSFTNYKKLAKEIKVNTVLALKLWATGNHDARVLATMIADPNEFGDGVLEKWVEELDNYIITDSFSSMMKKSHSAKEKLEKWVLSNKEWIGTAGHNMLSHIAMAENDFSDECFETHLKRIEGKIHTSKNRTRYAMNNAVIAIGTRNSILKQKAIEVAERIGKVEVDHGHTSCKTPEAITYIEKTWERKRS